MLLPKQVMEEMGIEEGLTLNMTEVDGVYQITPFDPEFAQPLKAFRDTEPLRRNTDRELAT